MNRLLVACQALALVVLVGCQTVGPNYVVPAQAKVNLAAAQGAFGADTSAVSLEPVPDRWWLLYEDPTLARLVDEALVANTDLRVAAAHLAHAQAGLGAAEAARDPKVSVDGAAERARLSAESYLEFQPLPVMNTADAGLRVSYEIDLFGKLSRAIEAARADAGAAQAGLELARVTVAAEVVRAYVGACAAGHELDRAQAILDVQNRSLTVTSQLTHAGRTGQADVTRARAQVARANAALPQLAARRSAALHRLAVLTGKPPGEYPPELASCAVLPRLSRPIPVGDGAALLRRRPDVRQAERALAAATARIGVATAALYPGITLGLSAGSTGLLADLGQSAANRWAVGPLISWSLPDGTERARIRAAGADADAALARFDGVVLNALREAETSLTVYSRDLERNSALRITQSDVREAEQQAQQLYRAGRTPYLNEIDALRALGNVDSALAASDSQVAEDQVTLFLALGGGWQGPGSPQSVP